MGVTDKIKRLLERKGLSAAELARRLGVKPQTIHKKLKADNFTTGDLEEIARVLGCEFVGTFIMKDTGESV